MKLADLSEATLQKISKVRWDSIVAKHEGPFDWDCILDDDSGNPIDIWCVFAKMVVIEKEIKECISIESQ
jgi:hypothetical protein